MELAFPTLETLNEFFFNGMLSMFRISVFLLGPWKSFAHVPEVLE
jgi:hypothetical protein